MTRTRLAPLIAAVALIASAPGIAAAQPAASGIGAALAAGPTTPAPTPGAGQGRGRFAERQFERMDADQNGKVTLQEFLAFQGRRFEAMDADHDGKVTKAEFEAAFARMQAARAGRLTRAKNAQPNEEEQGGGPADGSAMFARLDRNGDGVITREEYDAMLTRRFERLDGAHKGYLTADDMRAGPGGGRGGFGG